MSEENQTPPETAPEPKWFIDDGVPGQGDRPAWLPDKYKTVADMAKSNAELEKRFGQVPDDYDFSKSRYLDGDYEPFQELKKVAKEKRVSQDVFDKMLESVDKYMDEFKTDFDEEVKKIGDNAKDRITVVDNWAKANLTQEAYEALRSNLKTADSFKAIEELRGKVMSNTTQVPGNSGGVAAPVSVNDLKMEMANNIEKYQNDEAYRKDWQKRLEVAVKSDPTHVDKVGG